MSPITRPGVLGTPACVGAMVNGLEEGGFATWRPCLRGRDVVTATAVGGVVLAPLPAWARYLATLAGERHRPTFVTTPSTGGRLMSEPAGATPLSSQCATAVVASARRACPFSSSFHQWSLCFMVPVDGPVDGFMFREGDIWRLRTGTG
jgi:hypothetical protein